MIDFHFYLNYGVSVDQAYHICSCWIFYFPKSEIRKKDISFFSAIIMKKKNTEFQISHFQKYVQTHQSPLLTSITPQIMEKCIQRHDDITCTGSQGRLCIPACSVKITVFDLCCIISCVMMVWPPVFFSDLVNQPVWVCSDVWSLSGCLQEENN